VGSFGQKKDLDLNNASHLETREAYIIHRYVPDRLDIANLCHLSEKSLQGEEDEDNKTCYKQG
jgi:hypothetical protein